MAYTRYVPLRVLSSYTMLEGAIDPKGIAKAATDRAFPAIALTDRNGLYAGMAFADACFSSGVQPIIGTTLAVARPGTPEDNPTIDWLVLLAQSEAGYDNLCHLVSAAHLARPVELPPHVVMEDVTRWSDGLICLSAGAEGALGRLLAEGQEAAAFAYADQLVGVYGDRLYIEISRRGLEIERASEDALIALAYDRDLPLVATNPSCFADPGFHAAHDAMLCIAAGSYIDSEDRQRSDRESWIKSERMMAELFEDLPEAIANTLVVAQRCAAAPPKRSPILPRMGNDVQEEARQMAEDARKGLEARLELYPDLTDEERTEYFERLDYEVGIIKEMGFPGYFLIVADFIKWAKANDIPVGPGRGSGAGSVVAWALTITDLDPLKLGLLFERFLNPERVSMPDFDIDFCETRRGEVIRYVQQKYGRDRVAQIITFGKLKARAVLRDTGRVLQMPYGQVDRLCKLVPNHPTDPWDLKRALGGVSDLRREVENDQQVARLFELASQLEGLPRHSSTHAAGVVIGDRPLAELVPLYRDPRSDMPVTQFDMKKVEDAGLVKFDFLGLKTLSVLAKAVKMLAKRGIDVDLLTLPLDDEAVYDLMQAGDTVGVFQLESEGMRRTLAAVKPTSFGDIIALVSLYRPGPMDNIPLFGARKNGREQVEYPHELLAEILEETYGIFVYQEQVMQAAQILAGYTLGGADLLRRAMGKKIKAEMDKQRLIFVAGCKEHNDIPEGKANELFDLIDKFAGYGFNKSHAAAYALLAYQTAWVKAHYPHEFYAASMCFDMHQTEKLNIFVDDMRRNEIRCLPPCINHSEAEYSVGEDGEGLAVRYALAGLKNVGERAMEGIAEERRANGLFKSLDDFAGRVDPTLLNKRQIEGLAAAGAFDSLCDNRLAVQTAADTVLGVAAQAHEMRTSGQHGLFGSSPAAGGQEIRLQRDKSWSVAEKMAAEKDAFGFYFSAHPIDQYRAQATAHGARTHAQTCVVGEMKAGQRKPAVLAGMVESAQRRKTKRGKDFVMVDISDQSGMFSASCFEENLVDTILDFARKSACVLIDVELDCNDENQPPRVTIRNMRPITEQRARLPMMLLMEVRQPSAFQELKMLLSVGAGQGKSEVRLKLIDDGRELGTLSLGRDFELDGDIAGEVERIDGVSNVTLAARNNRRLRLVG